MSRASYVAEMNLLSQIKQTNNVSINKKKITNFKQ